jgi:hypothetical protein
MTAAEKGDSSIPTCGRPKYKKNNWTKRGTPLITHVYKLAGIDKNFDFEILAKATNNPIIVPKVIDNTVSCKVIIVPSRRTGRYFTRKLKKPTIIIFPPLINTAKKQLKQSAD